MRFRSAAKKCLPTNQSERSNAQAARRMLKISEPKIAVRNHAHTVRGMRGRDIPFVRRSLTVTLKFNALNSDATQKSATLTTHNFKPDSAGRKNALLLPTIEATVAHNDMRFR